MTGVEMERGGVKKVRALGVSLGCDESEDQLRRCRVDAKVE